MSAPRCLPALPFLLLIGCATAGLPPEAVEHNLAGASALASGELDDAEARFRLALEYHPGFAESRANLGLVAFRRHELADAEGHLRAAIRLDSAFDEAWSNLGLVLVAQGREREAARAFERALAIDPGLTQARRNLAELWMRAEDFVEARAQLMRLVQILDESTPQGASASALLAYCEHRLGRRREALFRAEAVLVVRPDSPKARLVRGVARAADGDFEGALADYAVAAEDPGLRHDVAVRIAATQLAAGHLDAARENIEELLQGDEDPAVQLLAAHCARALGDDAAAREHAQHALRLAPNLSAAQRLLEQL